MKQSNNGATMEVPGEVGGHPYKFAMDQLVVQEAIRSVRGGPLPCKHAVWLWSGLVVERIFYTTAQSKIHRRRLSSPGGRWLSAPVGGCMSAPVGRCSCLSSPGGGCVYSLTGQCLTSPGSRWSPLVLPCEITAVFLPWARCSTGGAMLVHPCSKCRCAGRRQLLG